MINGWSVTSTLTVFVSLKLRIGEVPTSGSKISIFWKVRSKLMVSVVELTLISWLASSFQMSGSAQVMSWKVPLLFSARSVWLLAGAFVTVTSSELVPKLPAFPAWSSRMAVRLRMAVAAGLGELSSRNRPKCSSWLLPG